MITKIRNYIFDGVEDFNLFGRQVAVSSFFVGLFIFVIFFISGCNIDIAFFGFMYLLLAITVNSLVIFLLGLLLITNKIQLQIFTKTVLIMLANIPVAATFASLALKVI